MTVYVCLYRDVGYLGHSQSSLAVIDDMIGQVSFIDCSHAASYPPDTGIFISSGVVAGGGLSEVIAHLEFCAVGKLSENFLVRKLLSKNATFGTEELIFGTFMGKIEILSTQISSVGNLQLRVGKMELPAPPNFCDS